MNLVWRNQDWRNQLAGTCGLGAATMVWTMLFGLTLMLVVPGCAWVRAQARQQSDECEELCSQANQECHAGRMERADALLSAALRKSPRDMEVQRQLADSLWEVGRQQESLKLLEQLADEHPRDVRLQTALAARLAEIHRDDKALDRLQSALANEPTATAALELKAKIELQQGETDAALATYQRLYQQEGSQVAALLQMGDIYLKRGQPEQAAPLFRSVLTHPLAHDAQQQEAHWRLGIAYAQSHRWKDAAVQLSQVTSERGMSADDWHAVAYAHFRSGDFDASSAALNHALGLEPGHPQAQKLSGILYQEMAKRTAATPDLLPAGFERATPR